MSNGWRRWATALNLDRVARHWLGGRGIILMLHRLQTDSSVWRGDPGLWITPEQLRAIITTLRAQGYALVTLDDALARLADPQQPRFACLTFDDGYRDNYAVAFPVLRELGVPATIYVTSGLVEGTDWVWWPGLESILAQHPVLNLETAEHRESFPAISWAQKTRAYQQASDCLHRATPAVRTTMLRNLEQEYGVNFSHISLHQMLTEPMLHELAASGLIELGAHTVSHPVLSALRPAAAKAEMLTGKQRLEALCGRPVRHFAYPYGDRASVNSAVQTLASECGFTSAVLSYGGPVYPDADWSALPRVPFGGSDSIADLRLRASGIRALLDRIRRISA